MYRAIATLQMTASTLQLSGGLEQSEYSRIMAQLRQVTDELAAVERRMGNTKADPIDFAGMLRDAVAMTSQPADRNGKGVVLQAPKDVMVEGPADDLHDLVGSLVEYARTVGPDPVDLRAQVNYTSDQTRAVCVTELVIQSPDVPDFLRRKLWDTVRIRRGQVSVITEPECCRIGFTLPIERRLGTVLG